VPDARRLPWAALAAIVAGIALLWPMDSGKSVVVKTLNWIGDPRQELPRRPSPLAMGMDDDADAVTAHDNEEHAYESMRRGPWTGRVRLWMRDVDDPLPASTERSLLIAVAAVAAWAVLSRRQSQSAGNAH
jgi:hypothetical protein